MKTAVAFLTMLLTAASVLACENTSGLSKQPRATFSQLACLDANGDDRITGDDADTGTVPDFNADFRRDERDKAFLRGLDIPLDPARDRSACEGGSKSEPEYLVAHGYLQPSDVSCDDGARPVLLVGVGGGVVNLRERDDAAGVRRVIDALQRAYDDGDVETIGVIAGPAVAGAVNIHGAMEAWLTHAVRVYFERFPCLRAVLAGHSHGAVTVDVAAAALEEAGFGDRILAVVDLDRVEKLYLGNTSVRPTRVPVVNVYQTSDAAFPGTPYDAPNVENWDATGVEGPEHGKDGGPLTPVRHTTIDDSAAVRERIVQEVLERS